MTRRMLIDATHAEETRVVVMDGNRLEDYDVESSAKKQLKGNIYLAKVIRVEPSLQAAFVEYGGNRHGFLAFSEIHPDYYQIPVADREKLLALQDEDEVAAVSDEAEQDSEDASEGVTEYTEAPSDGAGEAPPEYVGGETDTGDEALIQRRMSRFLRSYKIQEVIRRRQILLVQVVKEERGNKGAALTTYVSLAGRYCVLMPNALRGGGVSRKITSVNDRRRLKDIIAELQLPHGMAMIVRTAGAQRPRPEIMRDCEYLLHLWDDIRDLTMQSVAPALIYEEASLVKRAIRDLYTREIEEIIVDGEHGYKSARDFMRMLMPQNIQKVVQWRREHQPLFAHYQIEGHLDAMLSPTVQLRSGGYLVINQTEALVAIDVNSGRSTRERNIEETAVRTNLEAAEEVARQLRLRDLAGLIVIDFIDMESRRHNAQVERRLKDALRHDRARIQVGGISHFGLLEMSRQRLRPSVAESAFVACPHCQGTGILRGIESSALHVLRAIEDEAGRRPNAELVVYVAGEIALYILNQKRSWLAEVEDRCGVRIAFEADSSLPPPTLRIERIRDLQVRHSSAPVLSQDQEIPHVHEARETIETVPEVIEPVAEEENSAPVAEEGETGQRRRRRRRRRRGPREANEIRGSEGGQPYFQNAGEEVDGEDDDHSSSDISAEISQSPMGEGQNDIPAHADNLMPGRSRTRTARKGNNRYQQSWKDAEEEPRPQQSRPLQQNRTEKAPGGWKGPTPADPFGGGYTDIFDLLEQTEGVVQEPKRVTPVQIQTIAEVPEVQEDVPAVVEVVEEEVAAKKPARRRGRPRRKSVDAEPVAIEAPVEEVSSSEEPEKKREKTAPRRAAVVVEPTVIGDDASAVAAPRKGWWNR